jgi:hypothetical protein
VIPLQPLDTLSFILLVLGLLLAVLPIGLAILMTMEMLRGEVRTDSSAKFQTGFILGIGVILLCATLFVVFVVPRIILFPLAWALVFMLIGGRNLYYGLSFNSDLWPLFSNKEPITERLFGQKGRRNLRQAGYILGGVSALGLGIILCAYSLFLWIIMIR